MKLPYTKLPHGFKRPIVRIAVAHNGRQVPYFALIDSGADMNLMHAELAPLLGIDLEAGERRDIGGIVDGERRPFYLHRVTLLGKSKLRRYAEYADDDVRNYIRWLLIQAEIVADTPAPRVVLNDPKDDPIIAAAVEAKADYLITGDRAHLLPIGEYQGIRIISPREFLKILG